MLPSLEFHFIFTYKHDISFAHERTPKLPPLPAGEDRDEAPETPPKAMDIVPKSENIQKISVPLVRLHIDSIVVHISASKQEYVGLRIW